MAPCTHHHEYSDINNQTLSFRRNRTNCLLNKITDKKVYFIYEVSEIRPSDEIKCQTRSKPVMTAPTYSHSLSSSVIEAVMKKIKASK